MPRPSFAFITAFVSVSLCVSAFVSALPTAAAADAAPERQQPQRQQAVVADYDFYIGGATVAVASIRGEVVGDAYRVRTDIRSAGLMEPLLRARFTAVAAGDLDDMDRLGPDRFQTQYRTMGVWQTGAIDYRGGRPAQVLVTPPLVDEQVLLDPFLQGGALDPASALLAGLITHIDEDQICNRSIPIFDGRWRYDVLLLPYSPEVGDVNAPAPDWPGPLHRCFGIYERLSGFPTEILLRERYATFDVWFEEPQNGMARAVRVAGRSRLGYVIGNLRATDADREAAARQNQAALAAE